MKFRVMIVDDDQAIREILLDYVANALNCETVALADVKSAVAACKVFKPYLILTDYDMPGANGIDLIKEVKATMPHVSIVMMTACGKIETAVEAMKQGAEDFITKPFNFYAIDLMIQRLAVKRNSIKTLQAIEAQHIESVIAQCDSVAEAAERLGVNASTIWRKRKKAA